MLLIAEIAAVVVILGLVALAVTRSGQASEREAVTERRVEAYMATVRRGEGDPRLMAMSDLELRDLLLSGARNLRIDAARRTVTLWGISAVAVVAALVVGSQDGLVGFGIALGIGAIVTYGVGEYLGRRMREPLSSLGVDIERLRVE